MTPMECALHAEIQRLRAELADAKDVLRHTANCLPDMPLVALQTLQLAGVVP